MPSFDVHIYWTVTLHQIFSGETFTVLLNDVTSDEPNPALIMLKAIEDHVIPAPGLYATVIIKFEVAQNSGLLMHRTERIYLSDVAPNTNPPQEDADHAQAQ